MHQQEFPKYQVIGVWWWKIGEWEKKAKKNEMKNLIHFKVVLKINKGDFEN